MLRILFILFMLLCQSCSEILPSDCLQIRHETIDIFNDINDYNAMRGLRTYRYILHEPTIVNETAMANINVTILGDFSRMLVELSYQKIYGIWLFRCFEMH